jgi:selenide,water dikinase
LDPEALSHVLRPLQEKFTPAQFPDLLVGLGQPDDAAVYRLPDGRALVQTVDFFPPVVDDPYPYGAIAAANALSDIYAMGADPVFALNICAFPEDLPGDVISEILRGGADKVLEAGAAIAGGHSLRDKEPKYGLAVTGMLNLTNLLTKGAAQPGDVLLLTKPLGIGVITTAIKRERAQAAHVEMAIASMSRLNRAASFAARSTRVRAATDITGYGLIGHALEMADAAGVQFHFRYGTLPFLPGTLDYASEWMFAGGVDSNKKAAEGRVQFAHSLKEEERMLLYDPQTSGGLLLAVNLDRVDAFMQAMKDSGEQAWQVGDVVLGTGIVVTD